MPDYLKRLAFVLLPILLCAGFAPAQDTLYFSLQDGNDLSPIPDASVKILFDQDGSVPVEIETAVHIGKGRYWYVARSAEWRANFLISAQGYENTSLSEAEFKQMAPTLLIEPKSFETDGIVVTTDKFGTQQSKIAHSMRVIDSREVQLLNSQTAADLLQNSGDVFVQKSQAGGGSPNIRGFEANKVMIVIDGVRMNNAIYRGGHLQNVITIDPNMLDRTEVVFGPGSVMYGSDALGGVMNFITRKPALGAPGKPNIGGNALLRGASANREKTAHLDFNLGFEQIGFLTSITATDYDDLRSGRNHPADYPEFGKRFWHVDRIGGIDSIVQQREDEAHIQRFSGYTQYDFLQKVHFVHKRIPLSHTANFQFSTSSDVPRYDRLTQLSDTLPQYADWHYGPQKRLFGMYKATMGKMEGIGFFDVARLTLAYQDIEESRINRRYRRVDERHRIENVQVYSANFDAEKGFGEQHKLDYGLELSLNRVQSRAFTRNVEDGTEGPLDTRYPDGGSVMRFMAAYASWRWEPVKDRLYVNAGARLNDVYLRARFEDKSFFPFLQDEVEQRAIAPSGSLGLIYMPTGGWRFNLLAATGFRAPNVDDIGKTFDSSPGNVIVPNPGLKPEYTYNGEIGVQKTFANKLRIRVAVFGTRYDDALVVRDFSLNGQDSILYDSTLSRVQANVNAGQAVLRGGSFNFDWEIIDGLSLDQTLTLLKGTDISNDSTIPLDHIPPLFGRTMLKYERRKFSAQLYAIYNGRKPIEAYSPSGEDNQKFAPADGMPAWWTLNTKFSYVFNKHLRLQFGVENLLDRHYRVFASGISAPGRNFILALRAGF